MADECIICGFSDSNLAQCRDISSWATLYRAAVIRNQKRILEASTESELPENPIKYHRNCRAEFTNKRDLQIANELPEMWQLEGLEMLQGEALETQISQAQQFCQINICFVKSQSTSQTQRPERSYTVYRNFAPMKR